MEQEFYRIVQALENEDQIQALWLATNSEWNSSADVVLSAARQILRERKIGRNLVVS